MLAKVKARFLGLKTWQKVVVGFVVFSFAVSPFTGRTSSDVGETQTPTPPPTEMPSEAPTIAPTEMPSEAPTIAPTEMPSEAPAIELTPDQENAIYKAMNYLDYTAFSKKGLIEQLEYEGFSKADSNFAVSYIDVDWFEQAALKAADYLDYSSFSRQGLYDQLRYEGFTKAQANYGVSEAY
jgi:hypothetical protein